MIHSGNLPLLAARVLAGTLSREEFQALAIGPAGASQWEALLQASLSEGLAGVLAEELAGVAGWSQYTAPFQKGEFLRSVSYHALLRELAEILRSLETEGLLLKGAALLKTVYAGQMGIRPIGDVDLLLSGDSLWSVERALVQRGFEPVSKGSSSLQRGQQLVDLHGDLLNAHLVPSRARAYRLSHEEFLDRSQPLQQSLTSLRVPHPVDHLLLLCVHALKHSHSRLFWLLDVCLLAPLCNRTELLERSRLTGTERPLAYALTLVETLFKQPAPAELTRRYSPGERLYLMMVGQRRNLHGFGELLTCLSLPGGPARLRYLIELIRPRTGGWRKLPERMRMAANRLLSLLGLHGG